MALRLLERGDREEFLRLAAESRTLHRPWTYPPERPEQFDELYARSRRDDTVCLLACLREGGEITGVLILSQIVRGAFQSAYLGYYAHERHAGKGYMREAMAPDRRARVRPARACTGWRPTSSPATPPRSRSRARPASGSRASRRATC